MTYTRRISSKGVMLCERNFFAVMPHHVRVGQRFCQLKNDPDLLVSHMTLLPISMPVCNRMKSLVFRRMMHPFVNCWEKTIGA